MRACAGLVLCAAARWQPSIPPPVAQLGPVLGGAGLSTAALVALNIAQNGPEQPASLDTLALAKVPPTLDARADATSEGGVVVSGPFTPTDVAPECLEDLLTLRTKADIVRAWRNGLLPDVPGRDGLELYDGAILRRGVLSPVSSFITHKMLALGRRWRGKAFQAGSGCNRFGGTQPNRFGVTSSDARELERLIREQAREQKALRDPLMRELAQTSEGDRAKRTAAIRAPPAARADGVAQEERRLLPFAARIEPSRLDGRPALVLDYAVGGRGLADGLWGRVMGMRDELREVCPGVLVGLGSFRMTGGVRNCAPFVLVRAQPVD